MTLKEEVSNNDCYCTRWWQRSLVNDYPELPFPLIPVSGEPFLFWVTQWLKTLGFSHIVYSAGHFAEKVTAWAHHAASIDPSLCLDVVVEHRSLGTAGATTLCANRFPSSFTFVVNGNSILLGRSQTHHSKI